MQPPSRIEVLTSPSPERRTKLRFDLSFPVLLRTTGDSWKAGESRNLSVRGAFVLTDSRFMVRPDAEYILRVPPELTKAAQPLMIHFRGTILRCEHVREEDSSFGIALQSRDYRYLPKDEVAKFGALLEEISPTPNE